MSIKKFFDLYYSDALNAYYKIRDNSITLVILKDNVLIKFVMEYKENISDITGRVYLNDMEKEMETNTLTRESDEK